MKRVIMRIQNSNGTITAIFSDGSMAVIDPTSGQIVQQDDSPNPVRAALASSGDEDAAARTVRAASAEDARRFDVTSGLSSRGLDIQEQQLEQNHKVALMNARTQADVAQANREYQQGQLQLARERLGFDRESFDKNFGLQQAGLGARMIETGASLSGPATLFEAYDLNRGYGAMQDTPAFLSALRDNTRLRDFGAQGGTPAPKTLESIAAKMAPGYANSAEARTTENALGTIADIGAAGAHRIGAGQYESLNPSERASFLSGLGKAGFDRESFLADWRRSRIGQGFSSSAAA